ncbi:MAG: DUF1818 family protein [Cyanobacteria bacterium Co-bin13]|nr:DUF1818 family protein [Cyanobacteria bacterium Co-bin13]
MGRYIKEGNGWRLGWNAEAPTYQGLIAGEDWSIELTQSEFQDFCDLVQQLSGMMSQMTNELMEAERIAVEAETERIWLEVEGFPHRYSLHVIVQTGRCCEGSWSEDAVVELLQAIPRLTLF